MLLGRAMNELSNMDGTINATATENNYVLLYGDFAAGMVIVDRIGSTLELVPYLFGSNRRPTGQRGLRGGRRLSRVFLSALLSGHKVSLSSSGRELLPDRVTPEALRRPAELPVRLRRTRVAELVRDRVGNPPRTLTSSATLTSIPVDHYQDSSRRRPW